MWVISCFNPQGLLIKVGNATLTDSMILCKVNVFFFSVLIPQEDKELQKVAVFPIAGLVGAHQDPVGSFEAKVWCSMTGSASTMESKRHQGGQARSGLSLSVASHFGMTPMAWQSSFGTLLLHPSIFPLHHLILGRIPILKLVKTSKRRILMMC